MKLLSRSLRPIAACVLLLALGGCGGGGPLPPVFGAVFGLEGAEVAPFRVGKIADPVVGAGDRVIGQAASDPDQCIYLRDGRTRLRAPCPDGYRP